VIAPNCYIYSSDLVARISGYAGCEFVIEFVGEKEAQLYADLLKEHAQLRRTARRLYVKFIKDVGAFDMAKEYVRCVYKLKNGEVVEELCQ